MRQTSEKFAEIMLEAEQHETPISFAEQIAKVEQQMTERINDMTDKILASVTEQQKSVQSTELEELTDNDNNVSRETSDNENEENESEE